MEWTFTGVGFAALVVALVIMWRHRWEGSRFTVICMLLGGLAIASGGGLIRRLLASGGEQLARLSESATSQLIGVGIAGLAVLAMLVWLLVDLKDSSIHKATPWIAVALPTLATVVGGATIGADIIDWFRTAGAA